MEEKIIAAIEKLSRARKFLIWSVAKKHKLTALQLQIIIYLDSHSLKFSNISQIAKEFNITKATVSKAISALARKKLITRKKYLSDNRSYKIVITAKGKRNLADFYSWRKQLEVHSEKFPDRVKEAALVFLIGLIASLKEADIITVARMCISCDNFSYNAYPDSRNPHYCRLLDERRTIQDLRIDCREFVLASNNDNYLQLVQ